MYLPKLSVLAAPIGTTSTDADNIFISRKRTTSTAQLKIVGDTSSNQLSILCKLWRNLCWVMGGTSITWGTLYSDDVANFEATVFDFEAPSLILFTSGAQGYLNGVSAETSTFHTLFLKLMILNYKILMIITTPPPPHFHIHAIVLVTTIVYTICTIIKWIKRLRAAVDSYFKLCSTSRVSLDRFALFALLPIIFDIFYD